MSGSVECISFVRLEIQGNKVICSVTVLKLNIRTGHNGDTGKDYSVFIIDNNEIRQWVVGINP